MEQIAPEVYVSTVYPGINVGFIITDAGVVAVDAPPLPSDARAWREHIREVAGDSIRYTILTDHHPDRSLSARLLGAPVIAGRGTYEYLERAQEEDNLVEEWVESHLDPGSELEGLELTFPEVGVGERVLIHGSPMIEVERIEGAAPGSVWVLLREEKVLFAGDTLVTGTHPIVSNAPDTRAWLKTLVEIRRSYFPADVLVPGRGGVCDQDETRPLSEYIRVARRRIRSFHTAGTDLSELPELIPELLAMFPFEQSNREQVEQRILSSLEQLYEELRPEEEEVTEEAA